MRKEIFEAAKSDIDEVARFVSAFGLTMDNEPSDGGWTASQCLAHLADAEISLSLRIRMMLTSTDYNFSGWDEDGFAAIKKQRDPKTSFEVFKSLRSSNLELLGELSDESLAKTGKRANGEPISIIDYFAMMSRHVRVHLEQASKAAQA